MILQPCSALEKLKHYTQYSTAVQSRALIVVAQPSLITFALLEPFNKGMEAKKLFLHISLLLAKLKGEVFVRHLATPRKICERLLLKVFLIYVHDQYDRNLVWVSATETNIEFRYRFRCRNFFCLYRNFPPFFSSLIFSLKMF